MSRRPLRTELFRMTVLATLCGCALAGRATDLVDLYGSLTGKTILMRSTLPVAGGVMPELPADKSNAVTQVEGELNKRGIAVVPDGPDFVILVPQQETRSLTNDIKLRGPDLAAANSRKEIPAGALNMTSVTVQDALTLYTELAKRTVLRSGLTPMGVVRLKLACPLTRDEAVYAMETILALNGTVLVPDGEKFVQAVPVAQRSMVVTVAPKQEPGAQLLDPRRLPSVGDPYQPRAASQIERDFEKYRKAFYEFIQYKGPQKSSAQRLLALYANLAGKSEVTSTNVDRQPIWFQIATPVTRSELLYAIETTFSLNRIEITNIDEEHIGLERISEPGLSRKLSVLELVSQLSDSNAGNRFNAGIALARLGSNAAPAVPAIGRLLATEPQKFHDVMLKVVENCLSAGQSIKPILQTCLTNPNVNLRICSARTLWILDNSNADAARQVAKSCLNEADAGVRIEAASLLWRIDKDPKAVVHPLADLLSDPETAYDFRTIKLLGEVGPPAREAIPALKHWLSSKRSDQPFVTNAAVQALQSIDSKQ